GGLVEQGSVEHAAEGIRVHFRVTDTAHSIPVVYEGLLPDLFREGQGVVTHGRLGDDGVFRAERVLARHDENYTAPEVAEALEAAGQGKPGNPQAY
ncbi:MAG: cytochrome c maturation protein CcmE, partial [Ectothiorhodospira sp.]